MNQLIERVIGAIYEVANNLGAGFLEKVYERALALELGLRGIRAEGQVPVRVLYKGGASEIIASTYWWRRDSLLN